MNRPLPALPSSNPASTVFVSHSSSSSSSSSISYSPPLFFGCTANTQVGIKSLSPVAHVQGPVVFTLFVKTQEAQVLLSSDPTPFLRHPELERKEDVHPEQLILAASHLLHPPGYRSGCDPQGDREGLQAPGQITLNTLVLSTRESLT
jgi:hypothetical protein